MAVNTYYPSAHTAGTNGANFLNPANAYDDNGVYCTVTQTAKNTTSQLYLESFGINNIPAGSTINSVTCRVERKMSTTASAQSVALQAYNSSTAMGTKATSAAEPTTDTTFDNANTGTWSIADLANIRVLLENIRGNSTTACTISYDYVAVLVDFTAPTFVDGATTLSGSASLTGSGESLAPTVDGAASLSGSSALSGAGSVIVDGAVSLSGASSLTGVGLAVVLGAGALAAASALSGAGDVVIDGAVSLSGSSSLSGIGEQDTPAVYGSVSLAGSSSLSGVGSVIVTGSVNLTGQSSIQAAGETIVSGAADLSGSSSLSGNGSVIVDGAAALLGTSSLVGNGEVVAPIVDGAVSFTGAATLTGVGTEVEPAAVAEGAVTLSGTSTLQTSGDIVIDGAAMLMGASGLTSSGDIVVDGAVVLTGSGSISVQAVPNIPTVNLRADYTLAVRLQADLIDEIELQADNQLSVLLAAEYVLEVHLQVEAILTIQLQGAIDMARKNQDFTICAGDTMNAVFTVEADNPITGATITWVLFDRSDQPVLIKSTSDGITITSDKAFTVALDPGDTRTLLGTYFHEAKIVGATLEEKTAAKGRLVIEKARLPLPT